MMSSKPGRGRGGGSVVVPLGWNIDIDRYINPFIRLPRKQDLPPVISRFLGYRDHPVRPLGNVLLVAYCFVGTLSSLSLTYAVCNQIPALGTGTGSPLTLASLGAAAVLEFYAIDSPFSQPRNMFVGQLGSSVIAVGINKGFAQLAPRQYAELRWLTGALSCACSTVFMGITGTIHPPAGATALLATTEDNVIQLGWALVPRVMLGCCLMLVVALIINNIQRAFPAYWWTPGETGSFWTNRHDEKRSCRDESGRRGRGVDDEELGQTSAPTAGVVVEVAEAAADDGDHHHHHNEYPALVTITRRGILAAPGTHLTTSERLSLERIFQRLSPTPSTAPLAAGHEGGS